MKHVIVRSALVLAVVAGSFFPAAWYFRNRAIDADVAAAASSFEAVYSLAGDRFSKGMAEDFRMLQAAADAVSLELELPSTYKLRTSS